MGAGSGAAGARPRTGHDIAPAVADAGAPLPPELRGDLQERLGVDLAPVRVHTGAPAAHATRLLGTDAFAVGTDVVVAPQRLDPTSSSGRRLLAHEVAHVVQQQGGGPVLVQRDGGDPGTDASPCSVVEGTLTNAGLLAQLNRCRVYLATTQRGEGRFYDEANLFRRLAAERRRRQQAGHLWLLEAGLLTVPPALYRLTSTGMFSLRVDQVSSTMAATATADGLIVTPDQFQRFLTAHNIPQVDPAAATAPQGPGVPGPAGFDVPIPRREFTAPVFLTGGAVAPAFDPFAPAPGMRSYDDDFSVGNLPFRVAPMGPHGASPVFDTGWAGAASDCPGGCHAPRPAGNGLLDFQVADVRGYDTSHSLLGGLRADPRRFTAAGEERAYLPAATQAVTGPGSGAAGLPWGPTVDPSARQGSPAILPGAALGPFAAPPMPLPFSGTGIMFEGSHVSDWAMLNGELRVGGFRAGLGTHAMVDIERMFIRGGGSTTAELNRGTTRGTGYHDDWLFPYLGGAVAVVRADGTAVSARELMAMMDDAAAGMNGQSYSYSAPPEGHPAHARAMHGQPPDFCLPGGMNCINRPIALHEQALGGPHMVVETSGRTVPLADPAHASVASMRSYIDQPDAWFAARGLRRVPLTASMRARALAPPALGGGMGFLQNLWAGSQGQETHYVRDVSLGTGSAVVASRAEAYLAPRVTTSLLRGGLAPSTALSGGRLIASSGVAVVAAPFIEGLSMAFSDEHYTDIDYAARMTRSTVSAGGGVAAAAGAGALAGTAVTPLVGTAIGVVVGVGGYLLTDWLFGDATEEFVRDQLGEHGCTGGVGPGR